ncbi:UPF0041-domain-containing protein [Kockovaella imperatae]|uniref:Mitochondrial pyruvate carrier n=1 Tax=Kockovaella imperatae TaxID=4999 RepID=A0A1Y1UFC9_9TREE|nr:UPF0041-domain-containing protein [Kockovaella imperatae]ORX36753.1 UPF0041-domain-containing protein [Kockovaella imperatae]
MSLPRTFVNWIKSPAGRQYFFSTHFWGPLANWGLPIAALSDLVYRDEETISGVMSPTLAMYSMIFMRFAWRVQPRNYLLFACHTTNAIAQTIQEGRFINYHYFGGKERKLEKGVEGVAIKAAEGMDKAKSKVMDAVKQVKG